MRSLVSMQKREGQKFWQDGSKARQIGQGLFFLVLPPERWACFSGQSSGMGAMKGYRGGSRVGGAFSQPAAKGKSEKPWYSGVYLVVRRGLERAWVWGLEQREANRCAATKKTRCQGKAVRRPARCLPCASLAPFQAGGGLSENTKAGEGTGQRAAGSDYPLSPLFFSRWPAP